MLICRSEKRRARLRFAYMCRRGGWGRNSVSCGASGYRHRRGREPTRACRGSWRRPIAGRDDDTYALDGGAKRMAHVCFKSQFHSYLTLLHFSLTLFSPHFLVFYPLPFKIKLQKLRGRCAKICHSNACAMQKYCSSFRARSCSGLRPIIELESAAATECYNCYHTR